MNVPLRIESHAAGYPTDAEVAEIVTTMRGWVAVTADQRAWIRQAAAALRVADLPRERPTPDRPMRVAEVAEHLNVSRQHVRDLIRSGRLRAIRLSSNPRSEYRVPESALAEFLTSASTTA